MTVNCNVYKLNHILMDFCAIVIRKEKQGNDVNIIRSYVDNNHQNNSNNTEIYGDTKLKLRTYLCVTRKIYCHMMTSKGFIKVTLGRNTCIAAHTYVPLVASY